VAKVHGCSVLLLQIYVKKVRTGIIGIKGLAGYYLTAKALRDEMAY